MKKLSIVMVSAGFWPTIGGAERQALEQSAALAARGHRVTVLTRRTADHACRENIRGVEVRRLPVFGSGTLDALCFMAGAFSWLLLNWTQWDVVHAHLAGSPALAAAMAGRLLGRPALVKLGGGRGIGELATSSKTVTGRWKLRTLSALRPKFLAVVPDLADEAREFLSGADIEILPNGVDAVRYSPPDPGRKQELRKSLGWGNESLVFLYTGRFSTEKRLAWFLPRWRAAVGPEATAVLVGDGPNCAEVQLAAAAARAVVLKPQDDLVDLYRAADVFFLPSSSEGLSNSLLESMSVGLAVLASRVGGTAQTVEDGVSGLLFDADDERQLKDAVRRLVREDGLTGELGAAARDVIIERYSIDAVIRRLEALYEGAV